MTLLLPRRDFLAGALGLVASAPLLSADKKDPWFKISLAQWSLHKAFFAKKLDPKNFAKITKDDYGIEAVEYVNQFYKDKVKDMVYLADLKKIAEDSGVKNLLIMCDGEGALGDPDDKKRMTAVENHYKWVEWAKFLGCHSIRVNAQVGKSTPEVGLEDAADGLGKLTDFGAKHGISVIVENHGGLSSNGEWLAMLRFSQRVTLLMGSILRFRRGRERTTEARLCGSFPCSRQLVADLLQQLLRRLDALRLR